MFGSSLTPVVCRKLKNVLFTLFEFVVDSGVQYIEYSGRGGSSPCVPCVASFSGLSPFDCPFGFL